MATYIYEFATGTQEIEISDEWMEELKKLDMAVYNNDHAETRRHTSYSYGDDGEWLIANEDEEGQWIDRIDAGKAMAIAEELLTEKQKAVFLAIAYKGYSLGEYAKETGVSKQSVHEQFRLAVRKIKKFM